MAHQIYFNEQTQQHSFFSVKEKPWHGLGQLVDSYPTSREAIRHAGLHYLVEKRPVFTFDNVNHTIEPEGSFQIADVQVPDYFATVRTDTDQVLGMVGKDYAIVQNSDAFSFFDAIVGGDGIQYETAGSLGKGEKIFITAKLPGYIKVGREDLIEKYIFLTTSHDGYGSIVAAFTPVRIVCNNTLNAALNNCSNAIKIRHTANVKEKLSQAHQVMGLSNQLSAQLQEVFNHWSKIRITDPELKKLIQLAMIPNKEVLRNVQAGKDDELSTCFTNMCDAVFTYSMNSPTQQQETTRGTVFGAYNAVTGCFQNSRHYKDSESKMRSLLYGGIAQQRTQKAFGLCEHFIKKGTIGYN